MLTSFGQAQVTVHGGIVNPKTSVEDTSSPEEIGRLTNKDVIQLVGLGLSNDLIIEKIHTSNSTDFDTSVSGLRLLKTHNVSDSVIKSMISPHQKESIEPKLADGFYVLLAGEPVRLRAEVADLHLVGSFLVSLATAGYKNPNLDGTIQAAHSSLRVSGAQTFIVKLPEGYAISDYKVIPLSVQKNRREFRMLTMGHSAETSEISTEKNAIPFTPQRTGDRTWEFKLQLNKGEFGVLSPVRSDSSPDLSKTMIRNVFTFGVD